MATATHAATPGLDDDMSHFGAVAVFAFDDFGIPDDAAADARAEREENQAFGAPPCPGPELAIGGGVGIVLEGRGDIELLLNIIAHRHVLQCGHIDWMSHDA